MKTQTLCIVFFVAFAGVGAFSGVAVHGQQNSSTMRSTKADPTTTADSRAIRPQRMLTGRLPRYFAAVVSLQQRQAIYQIQSDYRTRLAEIEKQLDSLRVAQRQDIEALLSAEQLAEIRRSQEQAAKRLVGRRDSTGTNDPRLLPNGVTDSKKRVDSGAAKDSSQSLSSGASGGKDVAP